MRAQICTALAIATAAAVSNAQNIITLELEGEGSPSSPSVEYFTFLGSDTTADTMDSVGTITIDVDDFDSPTSMVLHGFSIDVSPAGSLDLSGTMNAGEFLGIGTYTLDFDGVAYSGAPIDGIGGNKEGKGGGLFFFPTFEIDLIGNASTTYDFIGLAPFDEPAPGPALNTFGAATAIFTDVSVFCDEDTVTLTGTIVLDQFVIEWETALIETRLDGTVDVFATAEKPQSQDNLLPPCNRADIADPCGVLDLADILAFGDGFTTNDPIADFDNNGLFDLADVLAFGDAFTTNECGTPPPGYYYSCYGLAGYAAIEFDQGNAAYALGEHGTLTAGIAVGGACLMLGFSAFRRRQG